MKSHHLARAASAARSRGIVAALAAAVGVSVSAHAGPVQMPCGSGWCFDTVAPLTSLSNTATSYLVSDMAAQFPGLSVVSGGSIPGAKIGIVQYSPYLNSSAAGVNIVARWNGALPGNAAWIQIINTNYNIAGYSVDGGYFHNSPIGPGYTQMNVDVPRGSASPNYLTAPPILRDGPGRPLPTASNPVTTWTGQSFLVSESGSVVTVYGGVQWGFKTTYSPSPITMVTQTYTIADASMGGWPFGGATVSGTYGYVYYSNGVDYRFGDLTVEEDVQGTTYTYNFDYDCDTLIPQCGTAPVASQISPEFNVGLVINSYALNGNSSVVPVSFEDFVYDFTGSGTLSFASTQGMVPGPDDDTSNSILPDAGSTTTTVPEPSTWTMMLAGFGGLGLAALRRRRASAGAGPEAPPGRPQRIGLAQELRPGERRRRRRAAQSLTRRT